MSDATPEDWEAMKPYQAAIDAAHQRLYRLAGARSGMERAAMELRGEPDAAEPGSLHSVVEQLMFMVRAEHFNATIAATDAGAAATAEWLRRTGQK